MGYLTGFDRNSHHKELKKWLKKFRTACWYNQPIDRKSGPWHHRIRAFSQIVGFHDVKSNFEADFRAIGWLYQAVALDFSSFCCALSDGYLENWSRIPLSDFVKKWEFSFLISGGREGGSWTQAPTFTLNHVYITGEWHFSNFTGRRSITSKINRNGISSS